MENYFVIKAEINPNSPAQVKGAEGFAEWCKDKDLTVERHREDSHLEEDDRILGGLREVRINPRLIVYGYADERLKRLIDFKLGSYGLKPAVERAQREPISPEDRPAPYRPPLPPGGRNGLGLR